MEISIELNDGMFFHTSVCWHLSRNHQKQNTPPFKMLYRPQKEKLFGHHEDHSYQQTNQMQLLHLSTGLATKSASQTISREIRIVIVIINT